MRIIDEKGRLFGIINVFDLLVLCIIISFAFFALRWFQMGEDPSWVRFKILHTPCIATVFVPDYMVEVVKEGDEMSNREGLVLVRIEKILSNEPANAIVYSSKDGEKLFFDSKNRKLTIMVDILSYERLGELYSCAADTPIKIGERTFTIHTKRYSIPLNILKILKGEKTVNAER